MKLAILIPSYKRPEVLGLTLEGILNTIETDQGVDTYIGLGLNKARSVDTEVATRKAAIFKDKRISIDILIENTNIGKANILNKLFDMVTRKYAFLDGDFVITMDNDMVFRDKWMHIIKFATTIGADLLGFASNKFWCHIPEYRLCKKESFGEYNVYRPHSIAGGIMLFPYSYLKTKRWDNKGGVYGMDDALMCLATKNKLVVGYESDWIEHDPLKNSTPELSKYEQKKVALYAASKNIFPEGWDE